MQAYQSDLDHLNQELGSVRGHLLALQHDIGGSRQDVTELYRTTERLERQVRTLSEDLRVGLFRQQLEQAAPVRRVPEHAVSRHVVYMLRLAPPGVGV
jgi:hypothetical protein